jgi:hypothetical protein
VATIRLIPTPEEAAGLDGYWGVAKIRPQPSNNQWVELRLNNSDEPEPDRYYELWFLSGDRRISAGSFTSVGEGENRVWLNAPPGARSFNTLLITEERLGNATASGREVTPQGQDAMMPGAAKPPPIIEDWRWDIRPETYFRLYPCWMQDAVVNFAKLKARERR